MMEMKNAKQTTQTASDRISDFVAKKRVALIAILVAVVAAIIICVVSVAVVSKAKNSGIAAIDEITYALTNESAYLEESVLEERRDTAMAALEKYLSKGGVVGVRANMLAAEIEFGRKNYSSALGFWEAAALKDKRAYTAPLACFNAAICQEELGDLPSAAANYEKAAAEKDFAFAAHAWFSAGRVKERLGDYEGASSAYQSLIDANPNDSWANLAHSRQIALRVEGKLN